MVEANCDQLREILVRYAKALGVPVEQVRADVDFFRAGGSSLRALLLIRDLERDLDIRVPRHRFWLGMTPIDIVRTDTSGKEPG